MWRILCSGIMTAIHPDIEAVRITEEQIRARVTELGAEISRDYEGKDLVIVGILKGATLFLADLVRHIDAPLSLILSPSARMAANRARPASCGF